MALVMVLRRYSYSRAVKGIGAALCDQRHLRPGALPLVGAVIRRGHSEFLNRVLSHRQHRRKRISVRLIVYVDAVEGDVALIAARAIHGSIARVLVLVADAIAGVGHSGLQTQQVRNVAALQRNLAHLFFVEGIADGGVHQVEGRLSEVTVTISVVPPTLS